MRYEVVALDSRKQLRSITPELRSLYNLRKQRVLFREYLLVFFADLAFKYRTKHFGSSQNSGLEVRLNTGEF